MAKPFQEPKAKMSPERQAKIRNQTLAILFSRKNYLQERAERGSREKLLAVLAKAPDVEPEQADRLPVLEGNG